jgi:uncharacterized protein (TIGR02145 family)
MLYVGYIPPLITAVEPLQERESFKVFQPYPNPADRESFVSLSVPDLGTVHATAFDLQGRKVSEKNLHLDKGTHTLRFQPGEAPLYLLTVQWQDQLQTVKVINTGTHPGKDCRIAYAGAGEETIPYKESRVVAELTFEESGILDHPTENTTYTFQFDTNIPCPGTPTVDYEGQTYNTIQIFSQCWLKENLNVGTVINGEDDMTDNGTIEKYCYDDDEANCDQYGGLYQWNEMMQYTSQEGAQGICPPGWHLPTDEEWKVLEGAADSQYEIRDPEWDLNWAYRGYDAGTTLKASSGWYGNGNGSDQYGFSGLPGGYNNNGSFSLALSYGIWWSSTEISSAGWYRGLNFEYPGGYRTYLTKASGFSVRCLKDD